MAPIIAPNVTRFTVSGTYSGQPVANVLDYERVIVSGGPIDVAEWNTVQAGRIAQAYVDNFGGRLSNQLTWEQVDWVDLSSLNGDVGTSVGGTTAFPASGASGTSAMPGNVAIRLRKGASGQRGSRPGSLYLAGVLEAETGASPNVLSTGNVDAWTTAGEQFLVDTTSEFSVDNGTYSANMVIVRTRRPSPGADPVFVESSTVIALTAQSRVASQRRRLTI